ncbi:biosynthetic-type acetolactate synthase large subunit [Candidatus Micrarchaeota archaeon]|nr:biosynthetic-type acetolactate synthase large subunit [Candidatus Micrarchaeota archaeon]
MSGAKAIVEALKREKAETIFGYPGGVIMPFYDALIGEEGVRHVLTRHEQGAVHAAEGYARASGKVGVCVSTSGPGATNLVTGIADAFMDSIPIVALSGQVVTSLIGNDAFQEADMFGITMPITKHNFKVVNAKDLVPSLKMAFTLAQLGRPGPVHVDLPKDIQTAEVEFDYPDKIVIPTYQPKIEPHPIQVKRAAELLGDAERPVIMAGGGVISSNASRELTKLAEMLMSPVVLTLMGKGAMDERHPLCLGMAGMHGRMSANYVLNNCDAMLAVGCRFDDRITGDLKHFAPEAKIIHIDIDSAEIGKNVGVELPIVADARKALTAIIDALAKVKKRKDSSEWQKRMKELMEACECDYGCNSTPIHPARVIWELNKLMPKNGIITTEVGQNQMWAMHFFKAHTPRHYISSGGLGTMGFGLPAAIGAKAACPDKPVLNVAGDGSLLMVCQEFTTSVEHDLPVTALVMNNNWLGMVKQWQKLFMKGRYSGTKLGKMPDFVKLIDAFGGKGERVERPSEIAEAIKHGLKSGVAYLIDVLIDPEADVLPMVPPGGRVDQMIPSDRCGKISRLVKR